MNQFVNAISNLNHSFFSYKVYGLKIRNSGQKNRMVWIDKLGKQSTLLYYKTCTLYVFFINLIVYSNNFIFVKWNWISILPIFPRIVYSFRIFYRLAITILYNLGLCSNKVWICKVFHILHRLRNELTMKRLGIQWRRQFYNPEKIRKMFYQKIRKM